MKVLGDILKDLVNLNDLELGLEDTNLGENEDNLRFLGDALSINLKKLVIHLENNNIEYKGMEMVGNSLEKINKLEYL